MRIVKEDGIAYVRGDVINPKNVAERHPIVKEKAKELYETFLKEKIDKEWMEEMSRKDSIVGEILIGMKKRGYLEEEIIENVKIFILTESLNKVIEEGNITFSEAITGTSFTPESLRDFMKLLMEYFENNIKVGEKLHRVLSAI